MGSESFYSLIKGYPLFKGQSDSTIALTLGIPRTTLTTWKRFTPSLDKIRRFNSRQLTIIAIKFLGGP